MTVRGRNIQKLSPSRALAGSSGVATRTWCPRLCSMKKWPYALEASATLLRLRSRLARLCPSSCAVLIATPLTIAIVSASPMLSRTLSSLLDHNQQAKTRPAYWIGKNAYVHQR